MRISLWGDDFDINELKQRCTALRARCTLEHDFECSPKTWNRWALSYKFSVHYKTWSDQLQKLSWDSVFAKLMIINNGRVRWFK